MTLEPKSMGSKSSPQVEATPSLPLLNGQPFVISKICPFSAKRIPSPLQIRAKSGTSSSVFQTRRSTHQGRRNVHRSFLPPPSEFVLTVGVALTLTHDREIFAMAVKCHGPKGNWSWTPLLFVITPDCILPPKGIL